MPVVPQPVNQRRLHTRREFDAGVRVSYGPRAMAIIITRSFEHIVPFGYRAAADGLDLEVDPAEQRRRNLGFLPFRSGAVCGFIELGVARLRSSC